MYYKNELIDEMITCTLNNLKRKTKNAKRYAIKNLDLTNLSHRCFLRIILNYARVNSQYILFEENSYKQLLADSEFNSSSFLFGMLGSEECVKVTPQEIIDYVQLYFALLGKKCDFSELYKGLFSA